VKNEGPTLLEATDVPPETGFAPAVDERPGAVL